MRDFLYIHRIQSTLIVTLLSLIILFMFGPKRFKSKPAEIPSISIKIKVEEIPATKQIVRRGRNIPVKPAIPIPVEDPRVPEDAVIDETTIQWDAGDSPLGMSGLTIAQADTIPPRPILQVMPEYPESDRKRKISGKVRLEVKVGPSGSVEQVVVTKNSTGSILCEQAAIQAAYQSKYSPGKKGDETLTMWTSCEYGFEPNN
jgi:TonB family protein